MSNVLHVNDENIEDFIAKSIKPVIIDFWAPWCMPCKAIAPILDEISTERDDILIAKIDVDKNKQTAAKYKIRSIPTLLLFQDGQVSATKMGGGTKSQLLAFIDNNI